MIETIEAYPLHWPAGYTKTQNRFKSKFAQTMGKAQQALHYEIYRLGGINLIVSTNLRLTTDGRIYAADMAKKLADPGVAIYFKYKKKDISMCCDQYLTVWENMYALAKGIEALRGMERWGVSDFLERAFTGFKALPPAEETNQKSIWEILGLENKPNSIETIHIRYRFLVKKVHPDIPGGSIEAFQALQNAYQQALNQFNL